MASASSERDATTYPAYKAFNNIFNSGAYTDGWNNDTAVNYNGTDNSYNPSADNPTLNLGTGAVDGEWLKLELPVKVLLQKFKIYSRWNDPTRAPEDFRVYGSNDNTNWTELLSVSGEQPPKTGQEFTIHTNVYYKYFAVVVTKISGQPNYFRIVELEYYGIPEYDPDAHGTDVIARSVPNVPNMDWLEVYYDGQDYTSMPSSVTDKSGNSVTGTPTNVTFDSTWKAFTFNASSPSSIATSSITTSGGDLQHSWSVWIKPEDVSGSTRTYMSVFALGLVSNNGANQNPGLTLAMDQRRMQFGFNGNNLLFSAPFEFGKWVHVALTYAGGGATWSNRKLYVNGLSCAPLSIIGTATNLNIPTSASLNIGTTWWSGDYENYNGALASLKFHGRALSSDEIWQLYAYQKEYFQVSPDVVTFKGGRLGIGTTEPKAVLDVNGDVSTTTIRNNNGPIVFGNASYVNRLRNPKDEDYIIGTWKTTLDASASTTVKMNVGSCVTTPAATGTGMSGNIGRFTAPVTGYYYTYCHTIQATRSTSNLLIVYDAGGTNWGTNNVIGTYDEIIDLRNVANHEEVHTFGVTLYMEVGDYIGYRVHSSGYTDSASFHIQCSAFLLNRV